MRFAALAAAFVSIRMFFCGIIIRAQTYFSTELPFLAFADDADIGTMTPAPDPTAPVAPPPSSTLSTSTTAAGCIKPGTATCYHDSDCCQGRVIRRRCDEAHTCVVVPA